MSLELGQRYHLNCGGSWCDGSRYAALIERDFDAVAYSDDILVVRFIRRRR